MRWIVRRSRQRRKAVQDAVRTVLDERRSRANLESALKTYDQSVFRAVERVERETPA